MQRKDTAIVEMLLDRGADIGVVCNGVAVLSLAAKGQGKIVKMMLRSQEMVRELMMVCERTGANLISGFGFCTYILSLSIWHLGYLSTTLHIVELMFYFTYIICGSRDLSF